MALLADILSFVFRIHPSSGAAQPTQSPFYPMKRGYVAYLRETPAGFSLRKQREDLKSVVDELYRSDQSKFPIVAYIEDPGIYKAGDIKRNKSLRELLDQLQHNCDLNGVLFWHAGHIARSMDDFLAVINELERISATKRFGLTWYIHRPRLFDNSLQNCSNVFFEFFDLSKEIQNFTKDDQQARSRKKGTNPGKKKIPDALEIKIVAMRLKSMKIQEISDAVHVSKSTVHRVIKEHL